ncbi:MAG TPA: hypothetical protein VML96_01710 [Egibacteraceae bacterium]|nr:hypothetical protein [Egibacteraceae bacterium]
MQSVKRVIYPFAVFSSAFYLTALAHVLNSRGLITGALIAVMAAFGCLAILFAVVLARD